MAMGSPMFSRRALYGFLLAGLALLPAGSLRAERYANLAGLAPGRFVWSPTVAPSGPVTILVSLAEHSVHVYRNGVEIGISNTTIEGDASVEGGVFLLTGIERNGAGARGKLVVMPNWRGTELLALGGRRFGEAGQRARVPHGFAALLLAASHRGASVVVAQQRSQVQTFTAAGPFVSPIETGRVETGSIDSVARFAMPGLKLADQAKPPTPAAAPAATLDAPPAGSQPAADVEAAGEITSLIVSRADLSAYVMKNGRMVDRLPIAVQNPTQPFGTHAAVLIVPASAGSEARWLAVGLDDEATAPHVAEHRAEQSLRRVRFMDKGRTAALASELRAGTMVVLMDGHGPSATETARTDVALLSSDAAPSVSALPTAAAVKPAAADGAGRVQTRGMLMQLQRRRPSTRGAGPASALVAKRKSHSTVADPASSAPLAATRARKGPLDHREAWPESIYWPY